MNANFLKFTAAASLILLSSGAARAQDVSYVSRVPLPAHTNKIMAYSLAPVDHHHPELFNFVGPTLLLTSTKAWTLDLDGNEFVEYPAALPPTLRIVDSSPATHARAGMQSGTGETVQFVGSRGAFYTWDMTINSAEPNLGIGIAGTSTVLARPSHLSNKLASDDGASLVEYTYPSEAPPTVRTVATAGSGPGQIGSISELTYAPDGLLYVWDYGNDRIQIFDLADIGNEYRSTFQLDPDLPVTGHGFAITDTGRLLVGDGQGGGYVYDLDGTFLEAFAPPAEEQGVVDPTTLPTDESFIAFNHLGDIFVVDQTGMHRYHDAESEVPCGNGVIDSGEECDDGNLTGPGDCCSTGCMFDPPGQPCKDPFPCTADACDGAGACLHTPADFLCDDGDPCDGTETCTVAAGCVAGTPCVDSDVCNGVETCSAEEGCQAGTPLHCDDSNACNGEETCDAMSGCVDAEPLHCDDSNVCNGAESCNPATGCEAGSALVCDDLSLCTQDSCDADRGCVYRAEPAPVCANDAPRSSKLVIQTNADPETTKVQLKWKKGSFAYSALGNPTVATDYALCVYDAEGAVVGLNVAGGADCGGKPCWSSVGGESPSGVKYKDGRKPAASDGIKTLIGKAGTDGKGKMKALASGSTVPAIALGTGLSYPVTAQLVTSDAGCWQAEFTSDDERANDGASFSAAHKAP